MDAKQLLQFPKLVIDLVAQLIYFSLTEVETFLLVVVSVLFGLQFSVMTGVTVFFTSYLAMRMIGGYVSMVANNIRLLAQVIRERDTNE